MHSLWPNAAAVMQPVKTCRKLLLPLFQKISKHAVRPQKAKAEKIAQSIIVVCIRILKGTFESLPKVILGYSRRYEEAS